MRKQSILVLVIAVLFVIGPSAFANGTWYIQTIDSVGNMGRHSSITLDTTGNAHISYLDGTNGDLKYAAFNGLTWDIETVDSASAVGENISIALDANSNAHISYTTGLGDLKYAAFNGATWDIETIDSASVYHVYTSLALDANGNPHISYRQESQEDLKYAVFDGSTWDIQTVNNVGDVGNYSSLALDSDGNAHISYFDRDNDDLKYAVFNGSSWNIETVDSVGNVGHCTSLALDAAGNPHISYYEYMSGSSGDENLKYAVFNGSAWDIETVDSVGNVGYSTSLALDAAGNARISYLDRTNDNLKYAAFNGLTWDIYVVDTALGNLDVGPDTSLALDSDGNPHISYSDENNYDLKYAWMPPPQILTVTVEPNNLGIDTVDPNVGQHFYHKGIVNISAQQFIDCPDVYQFDYWVGDVNDVNDPNTTVFMDSDKTVTAFFIATRECGDICHPNDLFGDYDHNCIIDFNDFGHFANNWLICTKPECD